MAAQEALLMALIDEFLLDHPFDPREDAGFRASRFDAGLAFVHFDKGAGGMNLDRSLQSLADARFLSAGASNWSDRNVIGLGMAAQTIHEHGTTKQRQLLRPLFIGDEIWCQLFFEPGAGSDLAGISTSAVRDGDEWVINGQKVWSTLAHTAKRGLLLTRSNPDLPKHQGLSYFLLDMSLPGVDVRPLRQMTGAAEFNEVFLSDVRIRNEDLLGSPGEGWRVAMTTLMNERSSLGSSHGSSRTASDWAIQLWEESSVSGAREAALRNRIMDIWIDSVVSRFDIKRGRDTNTGGVGPDDSRAKLAMATSNQLAFDFCIDVLGPHAMLLDQPAEMRPTAASVHGGNDPRRAFLRTRANSIEGGTSEILRSLIAERVLGLPKEPNTDKLIPWKDIPRS
jgi:alkylation response protein AidB-like acyl-CoA dehydrogenase